MTAKVVERPTLAAQADDVRLLLRRVKDCAAIDNPGAARVWLRQAMIACLMLDEALANEERDKGER